MTKSKFFFHFLKSFDTCGKKIEKTNYIGIVDFMDRGSQVRGGESSVMGSWVFSTLPQATLIS